MADDWTRIGAGEIVRRALNRLEARGRGILLLHDIHLKTALALPTLLQELKTRGYKIVHVVEAGPGQPKTATLPEQWIARGARTIQAGDWPLVQTASVTLPDPVLQAPDMHNFGIADTAGSYEYGATRGGDRLRAGDHDIRLPQTSLWLRSRRIVGLPAAEMLPAPDATNFHYSEVWKTRPMVARRSATKGRPTTTAAAPTRASASLPKGAPAPAPKNNLGPRSPRPIGHQIQLPRPTASL